MGRLKTEKHVQRKPKRGPKARDRMAISLRVDRGLGVWLEKEAAKVGFSRNLYIERILQTVRSVSRSGVGDLFATEVESLAREVVERKLADEKRGALGAALIGQAVKGKR